jgi:Ribosomal L38e protein family
MPKQVQDIKQFLEICRRDDARCISLSIHPPNFLAARIQKSYSRLTSSKQTKFKVRCSRFVYTLAIDDSDKADKIRQSLPPCISIS